MHSKCITSSSDLVWKLFGFFNPVASVFLKKKQSFLNYSEESKAKKKSFLLLFEFLLYAALDL